MTVCMKTMNSPRCHDPHAVGASKVVAGYAHDEVGIDLGAFHRST